MFSWGLKHFIGFVLAISRQNSWDTERLEIIQISWLEVKTSIFPRDFGRLVLGDQEELAGVLRHFPYLHLPNETIFKAPHPSDIGFSDLIRSQI